MWTDEDRDYVLAWREEQRHTHSRCGEPISESFAKANTFNYRAEVAVCHACAAMDRAYEEFTSQEHADKAGVFPRLTHGPHGAI